MRTINGKLVIPEIHDLDSIEAFPQQSNHKINTYQELETQIMNFSQQQDEKYNQEINNIQNRLSKLDKKCILLEEAIARQFTQLIIINICGVMGLFFLYFWFDSNHKTSNQSTKKSTHLTVQQLHK